MADAFRGSTDATGPSSIMPREAAADGTVGQSDTLVQAEQAQIGGVHGGLCDPQVRALLEGSAGPDSSEGKPQA